MTFFNRGSVRPPKLPFLITPEFFCVNVIFVTKTEQTKSIFSHTSDMRKQAYFLDRVFFLAGYLGAHGGRSR